jgi:hypothetical protein
MQLISSNSSDIQKYYEGSYVKIPELGDDIFMIHKVTSEAVYFSDSQDQQGVIWLHDEVPYNLDMVLPNKAMYQMGTSCYSLSRVPARQYHRGITQANCVVRRLTNTDGWTNAGVGFNTLKGYVCKPLYRSLVEAIQTSNGTEALSPRFAYQAATKTIWCDHKKIATVNLKLKTIACNSLLVPEIVAFLSRTNSQSIYKVVPL